MTYYHVGIGYLYAITYYYSVVDILLSDTLCSGLFHWCGVAVGDDNSSLKIWGSVMS